MKRAATLAAGFVFLLFVGFCTTAAGTVFEADHLQCYDLRSSSEFDEHPIVDLEDEIVGLREDVPVSKRAQSYCTPVDKNYEGINNYLSTWTCYGVKEIDTEIGGIVIENQFGVQEISIRRPELLCVPSAQLSPGHIE